MVFAENSSKEMQDILNQMLFNGRIRNTPLHDHVVYSYSLKNKNLQKKTCKNGENVQTPDT